MNERSGNRPRAGFFAYAAPVSSNLKCKTHQEKKMKTTTNASKGLQSLRQWAVAMFVLVAGAIYALASTNAHAAPPVGTVIGNQATATYTDAGNTPRVATSNQVTITVSQVKSFTLAADGARTASAGQTIYYPHTITNTGNGPDNYTITVGAQGGAFTHTGPGPGPVFYVDANGDGVPDNFTPITTPIALAAGGVFRFVLAATVPGSAANGQVGTIVVNAADTGANTAFNTDTTTVANCAISVSKALNQASGPSPSTPITVTLTYNNAGSAACSNLELRDVIPANMTYVANSGRWSVTGATVLTDLNNADNQGGVVYDFGVTVANRVTAVIAAVGAGSSGNLTFQVTVNSGVAPGNVNNTATYLTTTQPTPASTNTATYQVLQTASVVVNGSVTSSVNGTGEPVTVASAAAGTQITYTDVVWNIGNAADTFVMSFLAGPGWPAGTTYALLQSDGVTSLVSNTTPSIPVFAGSCPAGFETDAALQKCGYRVILRVTIPSSAAAYTAPPSLDVTVTATSSFDNTKTDTVIDRLNNIVANTVDLTNNTARSDSTPPGTATAGNNGFGTTGTTVITINPVTPSTTGTSTTRFVLVVNNTGAIADTYNLSVAGTPAGWTVQFRANASGNCATVGAVIANTGVVASGANFKFCAEVTVPATNSGQAAPGNYALDFTSTSQTNAAVSDVKRDQVTLNAVHAVTLTPNNTQQTFPGASVTYTHVLTNLGNVAETVTFAAGFLTETFAWSTVYVDGNGNGVFDPGVDDVPANQVSLATNIPLAVNGTRTLFVRTFVPLGTSAGTTNTTTLTATYNTGANTTSATDTTTVTDGLVLLKEQVAVSCAAPGPHVGYSTAAIPAGPTTAPGRCIAYRITATNTAAAGITLVVINDNVPANTKQINSCGAPSVTPAGPVVTSPGNGATGLISVSVGPMAPSASSTLTFCVQIDP
jgi:trimeric autotransporter adhesin